MSNITFKKENGFYNLYNNNRQVLTPKGNPVRCDNDSLTRRAVKELSRSQPSYTQPSSILCYLYTLCDLSVEFSKQQIADDLCTYLRENVAGDSFLYLHDEEPDTVAISEKFASQIQQYTMDQLVAVMVILCSFETILLAHHIINDVVGPLIEGKADLDTLKKTFLANVRRYFADGDVDPADISQNITLLDKTLDTFAFFFNMRK